MLFHHLHLQALDVYIDDGVIFLKPNNDIPACALCGESEGQIIDGHIICKECIAKIKKA
jgi:hypothetical protein